MRDPLRHRTWVGASVVERALRCANRAAPRKAAARSTRASCAQPRDAVEHKARPVFDVPSNASSETSGQLAPSRATQERDAAPASLSPRATTAGPRGHPRGCPAAVPRSRVRAAAWQHLLRAQHQRAEHAAAGARSPPRRRIPFDRIAGRDAIRELFLDLRRASAARGRMRPRLALAIQFGDREIFCLGQRVVAGSRAAAAGEPNLADAPRALRDPIRIGLGDSCRSRRPVRDLVAARDDRTICRPAWRAWCKPRDRRSSPAGNFASPPGSKLHPQPHIGVARLPAPRVTISRAVSSAAIAAATRACRARRRQRHMREARMQRQRAIAWPSAVMRPGYPARRAPAAERGPGQSRLRRRIEPGQLRRDDAPQRPARAPGAPDRPRDFRRVVARQGPLLGLGQRRSGRRAPGGRRGRGVIGRGLRDPDVTRAASWRCAGRSAAPRISPPSITMRMPSIVRLVSAIEVASTILRWAGGGASAASCASCADRRRAARQ